jgi:hypothetical protein
MALGCSCRQSEPPPLTHAVSRFRCAAQVLRALLDDKADVHALDASGATPLHYACRAGRADNAVVSTRGGGACGAEGSTCGLALLNGCGCEPSQSAALCHGVGGNR